MSLISHILSANEKENQLDEAKENKKNEEEHSSLDDIERLLDEVIERNQNRILAIGVGGAGTNAVNRLYGMEGASSICMNTDAKHLKQVRSHEKVLLGLKLTRGLGAGNDPAIGRAAADESENIIQKHVMESDLCFVTAGLGGGTGTGAAPVVCKIASEARALVVAIVTLPFNAEGPIREQYARDGLAKLHEVADTVVVIPNQNLLKIAPNLPIKLAFKVADEILIRAVKAITSLITEGGFVNVDFADIRRVLKIGGSAVIGVGEAEGEDRIELAVADAINNALLDVDISEARSALINVTASEDIQIEEVAKCFQIVADEISPGAEIIWGTNTEDIGDRVQVTVILSGVKTPYHEENAKPIAPIWDKKKLVTDHNDNGNGTVTIFDSSDIGLDELFKTE